MFYIKRAPSEHIEIRGCMPYGFAGVRHKGEQDIQVDRLDDYAHIFEKSGIDLIKIDAEGSACRLA